MWHKRLTAVLTVIGMIMFIAGLSFSAGVYMAHQPAGIVASRVPWMEDFAGVDIIHPASTMPEDLKDDFTVFWDVWDIVEKDFVGNPDRQAMIRGAMKGMLEALDDPYTRYVDPNHNAILREDASGEFQGIGAMVEMVHGQLMVISALKGSPAEQAGLRPGDIILEVDGQTVEDLGLMEAVALVRGPKGSTVTLTVQRDNLPQPFTVSIVRAEVAVVSIESQKLTDQIGYIAIRSFGSRTVQALDDSLRDLEAQGISALVLDLRGNPGGFLDTAIETVSRFIDHGPALWWVNADGSDRPIPVKRHRTYDWPMVVLIDEGSASASEIVAGALQDSEKAILVGTRSFGKGSVQNVHQLRDGGSVRVTTAHWLTRDKHQIDGVGLEPDLPVTPDKAHPDLDLQLNIARQVLQYQIAAPRAMSNEY